MNFSPVASYSDFHKATVAKYRTENMAKLIKNIKTLLIEKSLGIERDMLSQEQILFRVVFITTGIDLTPQFQYRILKSSDSKMSNGEISEVKRRREQYRRDKQEAAFEKLETFLVENGLGNANRSKMTRVRILQSIRDHVSTLPTLTAQPMVNPLLISAELQQVSLLDHGINPVMSSSTPPRSAPATPGYGNAVQSTCGSPGLSESPVSTSPGLEAISSILGSLDFTTALSIYLQCLSNLTPNEQMGSDVNQKQEELEDEEIDVVGL